MAEELQLQKRCIKVALDADLKNCLGKYLKQDLKEILDSYGIKVPSSIKKQELFEKAYEIIKTEGKGYLKNEGNALVSTLLKISQEPKYYENKGNPAELEELINRGFVFLIETDDAKYAIVPKEIFSLLEGLKEESIEKKQAEAQSVKSVSEKEILSPEEANVYASEVHSKVREPKQANMDRTKEEEEIIRYARSLSNIYGIYMRFQLKEIWDYNHRRVISPTYLNEVLKKAGNEDGFYLLNQNYIVSTFLENDEECNNLLNNLHKEDIYFYPKEDELDKFDNEIFKGDKLKYRYIRSYISRKIEDEGDSHEGNVENCMEQLLKAALMDYIPLKILEILVKYNIKFTDEEDHSRFINLYTGWLYTLRIWVLKGHRPIDLKVEKMQGRNYKFPVNTDPHQNEKIGRNDKCPCGSGKKFKNCCIK